MKLITVLLAFWTLGTLSGIETGTITTIDALLRAAALAALTIASGYIDLQIDKRKRAKRKNHLAR